MKSKFKLIIIILISKFSVKGQITLENLYTDKNNFKLANLTQSGYKYYLLDVFNQQLNVYNTNHSVYKTITLPSISNYTCMQVTEVSDKLFNSDTLLEYCVYFKASSPINDFWAVLTETGNTILNCGNRAEPSVYNIGGNIFKLVTIKVTGGTYKDSVKVYSLPGTKPCDACGGPTGIIKNNPKTITDLNPFPNPSSDKITVPYELLNNEKEAILTLYDTNGRAVKEYKIDANFNSLILDTQELSSGAYYYNIVTKSRVLTSKKIIIVK